MPQNATRENPQKSAIVCRGRFEFVASLWRIHRIADLNQHENADTQPRGSLIAAVELNSHVGPSFSNNFNIRTEEVIGTAHCLWTAYREGAFGKHPRPFIGWLMLVEDAKGSRTPVRDKSPHFPTFKEFNGASYLSRYDILCQRLMQEQLYSAAALIAPPRDAVGSGEHASLSDLTSLKIFVTTLAGHVATVAEQLG